MECRIYRWREHVGPGDDYHIGYRQKLELQPWIEGDQIDKVGAMLKPADRRRIDRQVEKQIAAAVDFAEKSPFPKAKALMENVYAG